MGCLKKRGVAVALMVTVAAVNEGPLGSKRPHEDSSCL